MGYTIDPATHLTDAQQNIINIIMILGQASPKQIRDALNPPLGPVMVQRHLRNLVAKGIIKKFGQAPRVYYVAASIKDRSKDKIWSVIRNLPITNDQNRILAATFGFDADFTLYRGDEAFRHWFYAKQVPALLKQKSKNSPQSERIIENFETMLQRYMEMIQHTESSRDPGLNLFDATERYRSIHSNPSLTKVFYHDFYSLPQFGKTLLGYIVQKAKIGEESSLPYIRELASIMTPVIHQLIEVFKCDAAAWVPHTLKRMHPLQDILCRTIDLTIPKIPIVKIIVKDVVPQKTLSDLHRRLENADMTNHVAESKNKILSYKNIIIIDDAIGSGATIEAIGAKIKRINPKIKMIAIAPVGSFKGFDIIKDI